MATVLHKALVVVCVALMSVNRNIGYMLVAQAGSFLAPLITLPYLTRVLGLEHYGMFAFGLALTTYLGLITQFGFNLSAVPQISRHRADAGMLAKILIAVLGSQVAFFVLLAAITVLACWMLAPDALRPIIYCFLPNVIGMSLLIPWFHQGLEKTASVASLLLLGRLSSIPFVFILVKGPDDAWIAALLHSAGVIVAGGLSIGVAIRRSRLPWSGLDVRLARDLIRESYPLFVTNAAASLYTTSVPMLVGLVSGAANVGLYNAAQVFRNIATQLMGAIFQVLYPRSIRYYDEDHAEMKRFLNRYLMACLLLAVVGAATTIALAPLLILLVAGPEFSQAVPVLRILIVSVVIAVANNFLGVQSLVPFGLKSKLSRLVMLSGLISLVVTLPLAFYFGAIGAAWSVVLIELLILAGLWRIHGQHNITLFRSNPQQ